MDSLKLAVCGQIFGSSHLFLLILKIFTMTANDLSIFEPDAPHFLIIILAQDVNQDAHIITKNLKFCQGEKCSKCAEFPRRLLPRKTTEHLTS